MALFRARLYLHIIFQVVYEAANAIVNLSSTTASEMRSAIEALLAFCSSGPTLRLAALRLIYKESTRSPGPVGEQCNGLLESLITDPNRSIATLAITTLLKTGTKFRNCLTYDRVLIKSIAF